MDDTRLESSNASRDGGTTVRRLPAPGTFGPFIPISELGRGGMGAVFRVRHAQLDAEYALKVIHPQHLDPDTLIRFEREMEVLARLDHPGIVRVHTAGRTPTGEPYYVMDLVPGQPLSKLLDTRGPLPAREAAEILANVARTLATMHTRGIVHRDVKPDNIIVTPDGSPRITDFGLARANKDERLTAEGDLVGTPHYMSPEQVEGLDPRPCMDIWSLGIVLFQLVTGRFPYEATSQYAIVQQILSKDPPLPSSINPRVPHGIDEIFLRCCERLPEGRYENGLDLAADLDAFVRGDPVTAEGRVEARKRRERRKKLVFGAVAVVAGTVAAATTVMVVKVRLEKQRAEEALALAKREAGPAVERALKAFEATSVLQPDGLAANAKVLRDTILKASELGVKVDSVPSWAAPLSDAVVGTYRLTPAEIQKSLETFTVLRQPPTPRVALLRARLQSDAGAHEGAFDTLAELPAGTPELDAVLVYVLGATLATGDDVRPIPPLEPYLRAEARAVVKRMRSAADQWAMDRDRLRKALGEEATRLGRILRLLDRLAATPPDLELTLSGALMALADDGSVHYAGGLQQNIDSWGPELEKLADARQKLRDNKQVASYDAYIDLGKTSRVPVLKDVAWFEMVYIAVTLKYDVAQSSIKNVKCEPKSLLERLARLVQAWSIAVKDGRNPEIAVLADEVLNAHEPFIDHTSYGALARFLRAASSAANSTANDVQVNALRELRSVYEDPRSRLRERRLAADIGLALAQVRKTRPGAERDVAYFERAMQLEKPR